MSDPPCGDFHAADGGASLVPARLRPLPISRAMAHAGARVLRGFTGDEFNLSIKVFAAMDAVRREEQA